MNRSTTGWIFLILFCNSAGAQTNLRSETKPMKVGTTLPLTCNPGEPFFKTDAPAGMNWYGCTATNIWAQQGNSVSSVFGRNGAVTAQTGDYSFAQISGTVSNAQIGAGVNAAKIGSGSVSNSAIGYVANVTSDIQTQLNGKAASTHTHAAADISSGLLSTDRLGSGTADSTKFLRGDGTWAIPAGGTGGSGTVTNTLGPLTLDLPIFGAGGNDAKVGTKTGAGTQAVMSQSPTITGGMTLQSANPNTDYSIVGPSVTARFGVDAGGAYIVNDTPGKNFIIYTKTTGGALLPRYQVTGDGSLLTLYPLASKGQILVHNGSMPVALSPGSDGFCLKYDSTTATGITSGTCGSGSGSVASVFGRTGTVIAASGDYNFAQIAGTASASQLPSLAGDTVGAYNGTTVAGLRGRTVASTPPVSGQALVWNGSQWEPQNQSGTGSNATQIQSRNVSAAAPSDGQALVWAAGTNTWQPGTVSGSGSGAASVSQLTDFKTNRNSATSLTVGALCSTATPCNARFGNTITAFTSSATITLSAGTGAARIFLDGAVSPPTIKVRYDNINVSCTGCIAEPGTSFPSDSIPLYVWNATSGSWDTGVGTDLRSLISSEQITNGSGLTLSQSSGKTVLSVDSSVVPTFLSATATIAFPAINTGACATEQTFSLNGANPGDSVSPGWPAGIENGLMGMMRVSAANTIAVRLCNFSGAAVDPVGASFRATVVRSF